MLVKRKVIWLIIIVSFSCSEKKANIDIVSDVVKRKEKEEPFQNDLYIIDSVKSDKSVLSDNRLYINSDEDLYDVGLQAVMINDEKQYNEVMRHYGLSKTPLKGLTIALLMANKNKNGRAYYDVFNILKMFYGDEIVVDEDLIDLLSKAKDKGYKFDKVYISDTIIYYNDLE